MRLLSPAFSFALALLLTVGCSDSFKDADGDGFAFDGGDCDDHDPEVYPGAEEVPDGVDQDCDDIIDEGTTAYDDDGDLWTEEFGDCDDDDPESFPGAIELADDLDNDCDGDVDEGTELYDDDGDGFAEVDGDCDDSREDVYPEAEEVLDSADNDCDGVIDEGTGAYDDDGDGYSEYEGDCDDTRDDCYPYAEELEDSIDNDCDGVADDGTDIYDDDLDGYSEAEGDCNDTASWIHPHADESCDGIDEDCNGVTDDVDRDGDGYYDEACGGDDCDDTRAAVYPGATESIDGSDQDCDGEIDEDTDISDDDGDGFSELEGDCDDYDVMSSPGGVEDPSDDVDNDCDGTIDEEDLMLEGEEDMTAAQIASLEASSNAASSASLVAECGIDTSLLPPVLDWTGINGSSYVPSAVRNQATCGSCVLFAGVSTFESGLMIQDGTSASINLSEEYLGACGSGLDFCGNNLGTFASQAVARGFETETNAPYSSPCYYVGDSCTETATSCDSAWSATYPAYGYRYISPYDEDGVKAALALGPVMASFTVYSDFDGSPAGGVYSPSSTATERGGHAISIVGYDDDDGAWIIRNSWGSIWGDSGYWKIAYGTSNILKDGAFLFDAGDLCAGWRDIVMDELDDTAGTIVSAVVELAPDTSASRYLVEPTEATSCVPFVSWETFAEEGDPSGGNDQCDLHSSWSRSAGTWQFDLEAEHCGTAHTSHGAVAHIALFCTTAVSYADYQALDTDSSTSTPSSGTVSVPASSYATYANLCSVTGLDGNGAVDLGVACTMSESSSSVGFSVNTGCGGSGEPGAALGLVFATDGSVELETQSFEVQGGTDTVVHYYGTSGPDHVVFVVPDRVDTGCGDNTNFASACTDTGSAISCDLTAWDDARVYGQVLFVDGYLPDAG